MKPLQHIWQEIWCLLDQIVTIMVMKRDIPAEIMDAEATVAEIIKVQSLNIFKITSQQATHEITHVVACFGV